jgi:hypothetical protein
VAIIAGVGVVSIWKHENLAISAMMLILMSTACFFGIMTDIVFIMFFRWTLTIIARISSAKTIILCFILLNLVTAVLIGPAILIYRFFGQVFLHAGRPTTSEMLTFGLYMFSMTNFLDALCLLLVIVVMLLLLAHRLLWPLIKRPIYAANRKQLIKNTKLLGTLGAMLLLYAFPNNPVVKLVTHFLPNLKGG